MSGKFQKNTKHKKKKNKLPLILSVVVLLLVAAIGAMLLYSGENNPVDNVAAEESKPADSVLVQDETVQIQETVPMKSSLDNEL